MKQDDLIIIPKEAPKKKFDHEAAVLKYKLILMKGLYKQGL